MGHRKQNVAIILNYLKCLVNVCSKFNWMDLVEAEWQYASIALVEAGPSGNMQVLHYSDMQRLSKALCYCALCCKELCLFFLIY
jgi:hypothetical protein